MAFTNTFARCEWTFNPRKRTYSSLSVTLWCKLKHCMFQPILFIFSQTFTSVVPCEVRVRKRSLVSPQFASHFSILFFANLLAMFFIQIFKYISYDMRFRPDIGHRIRFNSQVAKTLLFVKAIFFNAFWPRMSHEPYFCILFQLLWWGRQYLWDR